MDSRIEVRAAIEIREDQNSPGRIMGTLIEQGRVAGDRREVFAPGSIEWPSNGVRLQAMHHGDTVMRFQPVVDGAKLRIDEPLPDTPAGRDLADEIRSGRRGELSIHFHATEDVTLHGIREIRRALVSAVAAVPTGAYGEQARVEVRQRPEGIRLPVTISVAELAVAVRIATTETETLQAGQQAVIARLLVVATEAVSRYCPNAPDSVLDEAVVRMVGYLFDLAPEEARRVADPLRLSGAASLLSPWRRRRITMGGHDAVR